MNNFILFLLFSFCYNHSNANDWLIDLVQKDIQVFSDTSYVETVVIKGRNISPELAFYKIQNSDLRQLINIQVAVQTDKKWKQINPKDFIHSSISQQFKSDVEVVGMPIPPFTAFEIRASYSGIETMLIAEIYNGDQRVDTVITKISVPDNWQLDMKEKPVNNASVRFSKTNKNNTIEYLFQSTKDGRPETIKNYHILLHPSSISAEHYLSEWYGKHLKMIPAPNKETLDYFPLNDTDTVKWVQEVYETIQRKISYVDIEDALGALIPRAPDMTWNNKYGDCKDMAFLVHSILKSKGVPSYIAISRSLSLEDTFDFPSISLANHVICVAYINNKKYWLDATDELCSFGNPSSHTQDCEVFIVDAKKPRFDKVQKMDPWENLDSTVIFLSFINPEKNRYYRQVQGKSSKPYTYGINHGATDRMIKYLNEQTPLDLHKLTFLQKNGAVMIEGQCELDPTHITSYGNNLLLPLDILMPPIQLQIDTSLVYLPTYQTFCNKQSTIIETNKPIKNVKTQWSVKGDSFSYSSNIEWINNMLTINETFTLDKVRLVDAEIKEMSELMSEYDKRRNQFLTIITE